MDPAYSTSLRQHQHPLITQLANTIETAWNKQFALYPYQIPKDLGYVEGSLEGEKLTIENHCYQTVQFRKLHLELAKVGPHLDILHCVMFPRTNVPLPIFGVDIVAGRGKISAAIVDLSPANSLNRLPINYHQALQKLPSQQFSQPRTLPAWGDIFSDFCLFVSPTNEQEEAAFLSQASLFLLTHCQLSKQTQPVDSIEQEAQLVSGQRRYCLQQQKNDKTRRILERAFGETWADRYLRTMLFDYTETAITGKTATECK
ncbi:phycocyanobilin:ferredoxin oxidoreductase [Leptothoe kymatousa]|uniref:Phycocyanobilin:ferredoxin oxidoreductase n=1 Tax=Leptothoe kymatousa TAU-MAC 1615 TaxID=2364775 RepID=A0ABS5Y7K8_9CYAN|nr:phycocyanobilin:ferredoxin oxidoreductase [Leptothoe kymatousa]MBT9313591.1 phycocyanobilin:ferredoxin oxidoreductase [Leptothoe kymatousa TAU-MAC 1615]